MFKPLSNHILVRPNPLPETTASGIYIPNPERDRSSIDGIVIAVGEGNRLDDGSLRPLPFREGDHVVYGKYAGTKIKYKDEDHVVISENDVLGYLE